MEANNIESKIFSKQEVMKLLRINDERMLLYKNRFKVIIKDDIVCFDKSDLVRKIGSDFTEPFLNLREAAKHLDMDEETLISYARQNIIPFYSIEKVKGGRKLFKKSELDAYLANPEEVELNGHPHARNRGGAFHWLKKLFSECMASELLPSFLSEREMLVLREVVVNERHYESIGKDIGLTRERVRQIFERTLRRIKMNLFRGFQTVLKEHREYKNKVAELTMKNKVLEESICVMPKMLGGAILQDFNEVALNTYKILCSDLSDMDLTVRALNCLKAADIKTMAQLVAYNHKDLLTFRSFGKKSWNEVGDMVKEKGLRFGMDVTKYGFTVRGNRQ